MASDRVTSGRVTSDRVASDRVIDALGVLVLCLCGVMAAFLEVLLIPVYAGSVLIPIGIVLAVITTVGLPLLVQQLVPTTLATALPVIAWTITVLAASLPRAEGDVLLPGGGALQWASYGLLLLGIGAGFATVVRLAILRTPPPVAFDEGVVTPPARPAAGPRPPAGRTPRRR